MANRRKIVGRSCVGAVVFIVLAVAAVLGVRKVAPSASANSGGGAYGRLEFYGLEIGSKVDGQLFDLDEKTGVWVSKPLGPDSPVMFLRTNADGEIFGAVTLWMKALGFDFDMVRNRSLGEFGEHGAVVRRLEDPLEGKVLSNETKGQNNFRNVTRFECHRITIGGADCLYQIADAEIKLGKAVVECVYAHHCCPPEYEDFDFYEEILKSGKAMGSHLK